ncbi:MAG: hypothetical protein KKA73_11830 [Chloroflexi bacterium]|nr:hypothetical protein [Chloroflexota bacterium]MBU1748369.1 hypothetical protein [Chloroflexota bacterium]
MPLREQLYLSGEIVVPGRVEQARSCVDPARATLLQRLLAAPPAPVLILTGALPADLGGLLGQGVAGLVLPADIPAGLLPAAAARAHVPTLRVDQPLALIPDGLLVRLDCQGPGAGRLALLAPDRDQ